VVYLTAALPECLPAPNATTGAPSAGIYLRALGLKHLPFTRSILDGHFNPLVLWHQWEYPLTSNEIVIFCRVSKIGNV
jgi:hypothetical protein